MVDREYASIEVVRSKVGGRAHAFLLENHLLASPGPFFFAEALALIAFFAYSVALSIVHIRISSR